MSLPRHPVVAYLCLLRRQLTFDAETESLKYENSDSFCWMVHPVRALLARRAGRADSIPYRLAVVFTATSRGHHSVGCVRITSRNPVSARPSARMEETRVSCSRCLIMRFSEQALRIITAATNP